MLGKVENVAFFPKLPSSAAAGTTGKFDVAPFAVSEYASVVGTRDQGRRQPVLDIATFELRVA